MNKVLLLLAAVIAMSILSGIALGQDAEQSHDIARMCTDEAQGLEPEDATAYIERCTEDANANYNYEGYDEGANDQKTEGEETPEDPAASLDYYSSNSMTS